MVKKILLGLLAVVVIVPIWAVFLGPLSVLKPYVFGVDDPKGSVIARAPEGGLKHFIYLPEGYDAQSEARYPVIYHLHGAMPAPESFGIRMPENDLKGLAGQLEALGKEAIIVAVYDGYGTSMWSDDASGARPVESWIVGTLLPSVDAEFRTLGGRKNTSLQGFSMGGFGAMKIGLRNPGTFGRVTSWDGALHSWETLTESRNFIAEDVFQGDQALFESTSPWEAAEQVSPDDQPALTFFTGTMQAPSRLSARFMDHLTAKDLTFRFTETDCSHDLFCFMTKERVAQVYGDL